MAAPRTPEQMRAARQNEQALTIMVVVFGSLVGIIAVASFIRESLALSGPRRRQPWDV